MGGSAGCCLEGRHWESLTTSVSVARRGVCPPQVQSSTYAHDWGIGVWRPCVRADWVLVLVDARLIVMTSWCNTGRRTPASIETCSHVQPAEVTWEKVRCSHGSPASEHCEPSRDMAARHVRVGQPF